MSYEFLVELAQQATLEQAVVTASIDDGFSLLVYPLEDEVVVGIGLPDRPENPVNASWLLQKRANDLPRFGPWQPCRLQDGSWYVVRRCASPVTGGGILESSDIQIGQELLL